MLRLFLVAGPGAGPLLMAVTKAELLWVPHVAGGWARRESETVSPNLGLGPAWGKLVSLIREADPRTPIFADFPDPQGGASVLVMELHGDLGALVRRWVEAPTP
jgi:hypothetical protein